MSADRDLARRLRAFLDEHEALIRRLLGPHLRGDPALEVDELLQDVRIRLWKMLGDEKRSAYAAFSLARIVASCAIDLHRRRNARAEVPLPDTEDGFELGSSVGPMRQAGDAQAMQQVAQELARLPERRRRPTSLLLQGFNVDEIATIEGVSAASARNLAYRGLDELKMRLRTAGLELSDDDAS